MVKVREDMTGWIMSEHGVPNSRLLVIKQVDDYISLNGEHASQWLCECLCEKHTELIARGKDIRCGDVTSCGCLTKELRSANAKKYNTYDLSGEYGVGWTNNTNRIFYFDIEDYDKIKNYCWYEYIDHNNYHSIQANTTSKTPVKMQWIICGKWYDHIDRNPFNNRKSNLRPATISENMRNKSIYKNNTSGITGVSWDKVSGKWRAQIQYEKHKIALGLFDDKEDAIKARFEAEIKYFGDFAPQRHLFEEYDIKTNEKIKHILRG